MIKPVKGIFLLFLLFNCIRLLSQDNDAMLWMSANLEKKITPDLSFTFSEEVRMYENVTEVGMVFSDAGLGYKIGSRFRVEAHYRFISRKNIDNSYDKSHRYYFDLTYREKIKPLTFLLRGRFQSQYTNVFSSQEGAKPANYARIRLTVKADAGRKIKPYMYAEPFFWLNAPGGVLFDNMRYCAGVEYSFNRIHMIDLYYMIQQEYNLPHPGTDFIIGIGYYFTFPE